MSIWEEREEDVENALNRNALWAITYGDLMSYMVVFFMMLAVFNMSRSVPSQMSVQSVEEEFGKTKKAVGELFSRRGVQQIAKIELGETQMKIVLLEPVVFDSGDARLKTESAPQLVKLAEALGELPNPIQIEGHTDDRPLAKGGRYETNWELSAARAFAVMQFFARHGIRPQRMSAIGYGEFRPVASNDTNDGRALNRRIEINLVRTKQ